MATGRSDYPNQVNNVLGFPYIFRGALDVRATTINMEMKIAAARRWPNWRARTCPTMSPPPIRAIGPKFGPNTSFRCRSTRG
jgi:malate dehydrogenase (oxaloacetate-decarboxylating)(NADP+)